MSPETVRNGCIYMHSLKRLLRALGYYKVGAMLRMLLKEPHNVFFAFERNRYKFKVHNYVHGKQMYNSHRGQTFCDKCTVPSYFPLT